MIILPRYAAVLAIMFVFLSIRTIVLRRTLKTSVGDGGNPKLLRAVRAHSNFAEYVPLALLLIYFVELRGAHSGLLHALCIVLLLGRSVHAYGVSQVRENLKYRVAGMAMTFTVIIIAALFLLFL